MKKTKVVGALFLVIMLAVAFAGCSNDGASLVDDNGQNKRIGVGNRNSNNVNVANGQEYVIDGADFVKGTQLIDGIEKGELSKEEKEGLVHMREEEKLARDVYKVLYERWNQNIFNNISGSEQTHMDALGTLLERYDIEDPIKDDAVGKFTSKELQDLHDKLVAQGDKSLEEALLVGATIEDLDIYDLERFLEDVDQDDIKIVYQNLNKGSRNHLRAFMRNLERNGGSYTPQFITQARFDEILGGEQERGSVGVDGSNSSNGGGQGRGNSSTVKGQGSGGQGEGGGRGGRGGQVAR